ncbi:MAG: hypothetical protein EAY65_05565 [Alphaproteobacteria bacterium]|nr:MAG: hypothetical protein EAY65_05565 [Alphaproteobacteria bacterium]
MIIVPQKDNDFVELRTIGGSMIKSCVVLILGTFMLSACGSSNAQQAQYASWDNMYYYDPHGATE